jgi:hypothetical protein
MLSRHQKPTKIFYVSYETNIYILWYQLLLSQIVVLINFLVHVQTFNVNYKTQELSHGVMHLCSF